LRLVAWAELSWLGPGSQPLQWHEAVCPLLVGSKVGCLPGSPGLVSRVRFLPKLGGAGESVGGQKVGGGQDSQGLVSDGQTGPSSLALGSSSRKMYSGMSGVPS
jgi:hypothetical protein